MPITFACPCGKQLKTADENAGKRVKCPSCGKMLFVPAAAPAGARQPQTPASSLSAAKAESSGLIRFSCDCGKQLQARAELAGRRVKCPGCGAEMQVPGQADGGVPSRPAARKPDLATATTRSPKPKVAPPPEPDEDEDMEEMEEERPRRKRRPETKGAPVALILGISAGALFLLVGGGVAAWLLFFRGDKAPAPGSVAPQVAKNDQPAQPNQPTQPGDLPPDLALVPPHAVGFGTFRIAKYWNDPQTKEQLKLAEPFLKEPLQQLAAMEQKIGLTLGDVERVILIVLNLEQQEEAVAAVVSTTKAYDKSKILALLPPGLQEKQRHGKTYHTDENGAVYFPNDHLIVIGNAPGVERLLDGTARPGTTGPLSDALKLAAEGHDLVVGVNVPADKVNELRKDLPDEARPYEALLDAQTVALTMSGTRDVQMQLYLTYADEAKAAKAKDAAVAALAFGRTMLAAQKKELARQPNGAQIVQALAPLEKALESISPQQQAKVVRLEVKIEYNVAAAQAAARVLPAIQKVREAANRTIASNNLRQIALAMHKYHDANGHLPDAAIRDQNGRPLLSWRVALLPYLEQEELYKQFKLDEPWDSPHNKKLLAKMPPVYMMPDRPAKLGMTYFQVLTARPSAAYDPKTCPLFGGPKPLSFAQVTDGTSNTLLIVEAAQAVPWTKPEDVLYDARASILNRLGDPTRPAFLAAMADGSVRSIKKTISEQTLRNAITPADGNALGPDF